MEIICGPAMSQSICIFSEDDFHVLLNAICGIAKCIWTNLHVCHIYELIAIDQAIDSTVKYRRVSGRATFVSNRMEINIISINHFRINQAIRLRNKYRFHYSKHNQHSRFIFKSMFAVFAFLLQLSRVCTSKAKEKYNEIELKSEKCNDTHARIILYLSRSVNRQQ